MTLRIDRKESEIEAKFNEACRKYGGVPKKQTAGGGDLDRRVVWPGGVTTYAEIKKGNEGRVSKAQQEEIDLLTGLGHLAMVVRNDLDIAVFIKRSLERLP